MNASDLRPSDLVPGSALAAGEAAPESAAAALPARGPRVRSITSEQLFADAPEVQIAHGDAIYRLRRTALGKLILTK